MNPNACIFVTTSYLLLITSIFTFAVGQLSGGFSSSTHKDLLLAKWQGPYQGVPAFDKVTLAGLIPAMEQGMAANLAEIELIANNPQAPTFENTIVLFLLHLVFEVLLLSQL